MKYLVVFEEAAGPEYSQLFKTQTEAVAHIQATQEEVGENDQDMVKLVTIYGVTEVFKYQPPVGSAGLIKDYPV